MSPSDSTDKPDCCWQLGYQSYSPVWSYSTVCSFFLTLRFMDGEISWVSDWVTVFSPSNISGLRSKNVKFGLELVWMTCTLTFLEKVLYLWEICKKMPTGAKLNKKWATYSPHNTSETKSSRNAEIGTNIAHGWCPNFLFSDKLCLKGYNQLYSSKN